MRCALALSYGLRAAIVPLSVLLIASCVSGEIAPGAGLDDDAADGAPVPGGSSGATSGSGSAGAPPTAGRAGAPPTMGGSSGVAGSSNVAGALSSGGAPTASAGSPSAGSGNSGNALNNGGSAGVSGSSNGNAGRAAGGTGNSAGRGNQNNGGRAAGGAMGQAGRGQAGMGQAGMGQAGMGQAGMTGMSLPPVQGDQNGYATRFWDCCKAHCGWRGNVPNSTSPMMSCDRSDNSLGGNHDAESACNGGNAHTCHSLIPWSVGSQLSYGYAATSNGDICGKCYQIQFSGRSHNAGNDPGSATLNGKQMVVQAINVGFDVSGGQFDLLVPGGGVGAFNACSSQWGVSNSELGAQYGGFLAACKQQGGGHQEWKSCVMNRCTSVFGSRGLSELEAGCRWFVEWFQVADNPALVYKEIPCPQEISAKTGMRR